MADSNEEMRVAAAPVTPLEDFETADPYRDWQVREKVRVIEGYAFGDLLHIELSPWPRKGGSGAIINIPYQTLLTDAHLVEVAPRHHSEPEHHLYEEQVYVLSGHGTTTIWPIDGTRHTVEWGPGALFSIPLNGCYQHFNVSADEPARYIAVTSAPPMMRLLADEDVIFNSPLVFASRFGAGRDFFSEEGKLFGHRVWQSNFIPNAPEMGLYGWRERGGGGINALFEMAGNTAVKSHMSEFPVGTYKKGHRHGPGYHLIILSGTGFSLLWTADDMSDFEKCDWATNAMVVVPSHACFHQHFNTGKVRARYLAVRPGNMGMTAPQSYRRPDAEVSIKEGGWQVEYEDEVEQVHELFEAELAKSGAACRMKAFIPWCRGEVGPTDPRLA